MLGDARFSRSSTASRAPARRSRSSSSLERFAWATVPFATAPRSSSPGPRSRPTTTSATCLARASTRRSRTTSAPQRRSSRSTFGSRTRSKNDDERRAPQARAARSRRDRRDRAQLLSDALVAFDVRERAGKAVLALPGGVRLGHRAARRIPGHLPLRRRLARDERRRPARPPPPGNRLAVAEPALRPHLRRQPARLHARGARLEYGCDQALRTARLPPARRAARLLHGQSRGRADHVEGP